jgi:hypothetical protein
MDAWVALRRPNPAAYGTRGMRRIKDALLESLDRNMLHTIVTTLQALSPSAPPRRQPPPFYAAGVGSMSDVLLFERTGSFPESLARRGHHVVYRINGSNHCPGCGRSHWYVGRITAECSFCGTAVPLAEARMERPAGPAGSPAVPKRAGAGSEKRRHSRLSGQGRHLQLLIDGSPASFALENISAGGVMGNSPAELSPGTEVSVRFEDESVVAAVVKWTDGSLVGLAFNSRPVSTASS